MHGVDGQQFKVKKNANIKADDFFWFFFINMFLKNINNPGSKCVFSHTVQGEIVSLTVQSGVEKLNDQNRANEKTSPIWYLQLIQILVMNNQKIEYLLMIESATPI